MRACLVAGVVGFICGVIACLFFILGFDMPAQVSRGTIGAMCFASAGIGCFVALALLDSIEERRR